VLSGPLRGAPWWAWPSGVRQPGGTTPGGTAITSWLPPTFPVPGWLFPGVSVVWPTLRRRGVETGFGGRDLLAGQRVTAGPGGRFAASPRPGCTGGGLGHSVAMIASNCARSHSWSAQTRARNSSLVGAASARLAGTTPGHQRHRRSGVDGVPVLTLAADRDLSGLGLLGHRDLQGEHAGVVAGVDVLGVEVVAEDQLAAEHAAGPFGRSARRRWPGPGARP